MEYKNWTKEDFEGVIFGDECMVEKCKDPKGIWVFRNLKKNSTKTLFMVSQRGQE